MASSSPSASKTSFLALSACVPCVNASIKSAMIDHSELPSSLATLSCTYVRVWYDTDTYMKVFSMSSSMYRTPVFIGLLVVMSIAVMLLLHHCILVTCCGAGAGERRGWRRRRDSPNGRGGDAGRQGEDSVEELSSWSRVQLVKASAAPVVCRYRKEEDWSETTCPVCLADFADGEAVRVLPECLHYFHAECIDTWLRAGNSSCPMCRAETTPSPSPGSLHHQLSVSLEDILVHT